MTILALLVSFQKTIRFFNFEQLLIIWSIITLIIVTITRAHIFQPDASRYVIINIPLIIGMSVIFFKRNLRHLLLLILFLIILGYFQSAISEWKTTPYRKINLTTALSKFCNQGEIYDLRFLKYIDEYSKRNIKTLFCSKELNSGN